MVRLEPQMEVEEAAAPREWEQKMSAVEGEALGERVLLAAQVLRMEAAGVVSLPVSPRVKMACVL